MVIKRVPSWEFMKIPMILQRWKAFHQALGMRSFDMISGTRFSPAHYHHIEAKKFKPFWLFELRETS